MTLVSRFFLTHINPRHRHSHSLHALSVRLAVVLSGAALVEPQEVHQADLALAASQLDTRQSLRCWPMMLFSLTPDPALGKGRQACMLS